MECQLKPYALLTNKKTIIQPVDLITKRSLYKYILHATIRHYIELYLNISWIVEQMFCGIGNKVNLSICLFQLKLDQL